MFQTYNILVIYLIILLRCANTSSHSDETTLSSQEQVKKEIVSFENLFKESKTNPNKQERILGKLEEILKREIRAQRKFEKFMQENRDLKKDKKSTNEVILLNIWRLLIDDYEESFPQPYENDFQAKKVKYDTSKFTNLVSYDLAEERRRQKWLFYCNYPPNEKMENLVTFLKNEKTDFDTFSRGIAKAYRLLSDTFHSGFYKVIKGNPITYFIFKDAVIAMRLLLQQENILDELIEKTVPNVSDQNM